MNRSSAVWLILLLALLLRVGAIWYWFGEWDRDIDGYLALAESLRSGEGFRYPGSDAPTAFRPPVYPLLLALLGFVSSNGLVIAAAQAIFGTLTVWLTMRIASRFHEHAMIPAGFFVAVDPLLLRYTPLAMTESLTAFLVMVALWAFCKLMDPQPTSRSNWLALAIGLLWGVTILTRPTFLPFWGLAILILLALTWRNHRFTASLKLIGCLILGTILVMGTWLTRNLVMMGSPILATTHGGYTLLLGNNPVFYEVVVNGPHQTWDALDEADPKSQASWYRELSQQLANDEVTSETDRDRWMYRRAFHNIQAAPLSFARSCLLRAQRFWGMVPQGASAEQIPIPVRWGAIGFYTSTYLLAIAGLISLDRRQFKLAWPLLLLIASVGFVHLFFWTNARMRAPISPIIAIFIGIGCTTVYHLVVNRVPRRNLQNQNS